MKNRLLLGIGFALALTILALGTSQAQKLDRQGPEWPSEGESAGSNERQPVGALAVAETVSSTFSYQGVLKEDGQPVTGSRDMVFRLYSDATCTQMVGSPMAHTVSVNDGFFSVSLAVDQADFDGRALWLETAVGGTSVGCQEIQPVPYALGLRPGAVISDAMSYIKMNDYYSSDGPITPQTAKYGLYANASNEASADPEALDFAFGLYGVADGEQAYGVYGIAATDGGFAAAVGGLTSVADGYAGYFRNTKGGVDIAAAGSGIISSTADSEIAVSPLGMVLPPDSSDVELRPATYGSMGLRPLTGASTEYALMPVDVPSQIFGVQQKLKSARVCYVAHDAASYISKITVYQSFDDGSAWSLAVKSGTFDSADCITIAPSTPQPIQGSVHIEFELTYGGTGSDHDIMIGKSTLTLTES